jgi:hypothetical protein
MTTIYNYIMQSSLKGQSPMTLKSRATTETNLRRTFIPYSHDISTQYSPTCAYCTIPIYNTDAYCATCKARNISIPLEKEADLVPLTTRDMYSVKDVYMDERYDYPKEDPQRAILLDPGFQRGIFNLDTRQR